LSRWSTGDADLIVSGDRDLLALNPFHEIPIAQAGDLCAGGGEASPAWAQRAVLQRLLYGKQRVCSAPN
jgi:hypothetical protein